MLEQVKERLQALGVTISSEPGNLDVVLLPFSIEKVTNHIKAKTNQTDIPEGLQEVAIDMVIGDFLYAKKSMGILDVESLNLDVPEKSIQDGDTSVEYAVNDNTPETRFETFLLTLRHNEVDFAHYKRLRW